jgi:hypothetical protein
MPSLPATGEFNPNGAGTGRERPGTRPRNVHAHERKNHGRHLGKGARSPGRAGTFGVGRPCRSRRRQCVPERRAARMEDRLQRPTGPADPSIAGSIRRDRTDDPSRPAQADDLPDRPFSHPGQASQSGHIDRPEKSIRADICDSSGRTFTTGITAQTGHNCVRRTVPNREPSIRTIHIAAGGC